MRARVLFFFYFMFMACSKFSINMFFEWAWINSKSVPFWSLLQLLNIKKRKSLTTQYLKTNTLYLLIFFQYIHIDIHIYTDVYSKIKYDHITCNLLWLPFYLQVSIYYFDKSHKFYFIDVTLFVKTHVGHLHCFFWWTMKNDVGNIVCAFFFFFAHYRHCYCEINF